MAVGFGWQAVEKLDCSTSTAKDNVSMHDGAEEEKVYAGNFKSIKERPRARALTETKANNKRWSSLADIVRNLYMSGMYISDA